MSGEEFANEMYVRLVRGNENYGQNNFVDNGDGTITDLATGLMWEKADSGEKLNWEDALAYSQNLEVGDYDDWRLPDIKELQSIVDYSRSVQSTNSPAINEIFETSTMENIINEKQFPMFWSSTTQLNSLNPYGMACYIAFGEAEGLIYGVIMDTYGAGAQRSDSKSDEDDEYPQAFGDEGDILYVYNYVRSVRTVEIEE